MPVPRITAVADKAGSTNDETGHTGLHSFYEIIAHENHHIVLWEGWWGAGGIAVGLRDTDNNLYPVEFEESATGVAYGFDKTLNDAYDSGRMTPITSATYQTSSPGYNYEEDVCRQIELNLNEDQFDVSDWSNDSTIKGKNQKK